LHHCVHHEKENPVLCKVFCISFLYYQLTWNQWRKIDRLLLFWCDINNGHNSWTLWPATIKQKIFKLLWVGRYDGIQVFNVRPFSPRNNRFFKIYKILFIYVSILPIVINGLYSKFRLVTLCGFLQIQSHMGWRIF